LITKRQWGAFFGTDLDLQLRRRRATGIVLAGIATSMGVESTARQAFEYGYNVTIAADAATDLNADAHARSLDWIFPMLAELGTTDEILSLLPATRS
jgi:nicotinamidase-related amidase